MVMSRGRRSALRSLCADLLKIRWTDESGSGHREVATLEDISPTGACLKIENAIPVGTKLTILYPNGSYQGRVKHCDPQMDWYFVGVEFAPGYRWSKEQFEPAHLLQFRLRSGKPAKTKPAKRLQ
jgi:PilZ domain